jgi:nucleoside-diphosphate-sugar epimerase
MKAAARLAPPSTSIHVADAAAAVVASLRAPAGTFNVVEDEPLTKGDYAHALAAAACAAAWLRGPGRAAVLFGSRLTSLARSLRVSNMRFRATADWAPGGETGHLTGGAGMMGRLDAC